MWVALKRAGCFVLAFGSFEKSQLVTATAGSCNRSPTRQRLRRWESIIVNNCKKQFNTQCKGHAYKTAIIQVITTIDFYAWIRPNETECSTAKLWHGFDTSTETISDLLIVGRQRSKRSAEMLLLCVTGCEDAVVLPVVRWSDLEQIVLRKEEKVRGALQFFQEHNKHYA